MLENNTELRIGPLLFTHSVQKIVAQERKAIDVLDTARTGRNFITSLGESHGRAQIRLLFTGLDEINAGINEGGASGLRALIALFKCCPIISLKNEYLSELWKDPDENDLTVDIISKAKTTNVVVDKGRRYSRFIPIALEGIELENVPDIPYSIQATLTVSRVDLSSVFQGGTILYSVERTNKNGDDNPASAFWLKKWIKTSLDTYKIPEITKDHFNRCKFSWYGKTIFNQDVPGTEETFEVDVLTNDQTQAYLFSENVAIRHKFAFNKLLGKAYPSPSHMGTTARSMSLDLVFNNQESNEKYKQFCRFKSTSDQVARNPERFNRITGWRITTPISVLLSTLYDRSGSLSISQTPHDGVYVPFSISTQTSDQPNMINCHIDMYENNVSFFSDSEIHFYQGAEDLELLRKYYDSVMDNELKFRQLKASNRLSAYSLLDPSSPNAKYHDAFKLFWPVKKNLNSVDRASTIGILNKDTLKAAILDSKVDVNGTLRKALEGSVLGTGKQVRSTKVNALDQFAFGFDFIWQALTYTNISTPEVIRIQQAIKEIVSSGKIVQNPSDDLVKTLTENILYGLLGDNSSLLDPSMSRSSVALENIIATDLPFSSDFKDALFDTLVERKRVPKYLPNIYNAAGVHDGFYRLLFEYVINKEKFQTIEDKRKELLDLTRNTRESSLYPDLLLPTYYELYGDKWEEFALKFDDVGIDTYNKEEATNETIAVTKYDIVSPACWFFTKRVKEDLRSYAKQYSKEIDKVTPSLSLSIPFNTQEIEELENLAKGKKTTTAGKKINRTISEIVESAFKRYASTEEAREDLVKIHSIEFENKFLKGDGSIKVYVHHAGNNVIPYRITTPGLGGEIYKGLKKITLDSSRLPREDADSQYSTPFDKSVKFHRHLDDNHEKLMSSTLDQIPDDQYSAERFFPAVKVYLIDRRGDDIVGDDTLFSVNSVISVDITLDKDDADLAVIRLADPLYSLQESYFSERNTVKLDEDGDGITEVKKVLSSFRDENENEVLKRYKLIQGRAIQIKMGYASMAYNLPIVFTGRITEILPGDQLTIVAQGWKAELINRKVSFYNDDKNNFGAKDLAVQAITYADPDGFGDRYPQYDANFILKNLNTLPVSDAIKQSLANYQNVTLDNVGTRGTFRDILNSLVTTIGLNTLDKDNLGFDTRLKNIWYPDTELYGNLFGLGAIFGTMPGFMSNSWIVPIQPAWDVLKEASRHAWNCIVQVVPYDTQATIFMGHPDQPYYYTKGNALSRAYYNKYLNTDYKDTVVAFRDLYASFLDSKYYLPKEIAGAISTEVAQLTLALINRNYDSEVTNLKEKIQSVSYLNFSSFLTFINYFKINLRYTEVSLDNLDFNYLPSELLGRVKDNGYPSDIAVKMFSLFFGIDELYIKRNWPNAVGDIEILINYGNKASQVDSGITERVRSVTSSSYYIDSVSLKLNDFLDKINRGAFSSGNRPLLNFYEFITNVQEDLASSNELELKQIIPKYLQSVKFFSDQLNDFIKTRNTLSHDVAVNYRASITASIRDIIESIKSEIQESRVRSNLDESNSILNRLGLNYKQSIPDLVKNYGSIFKAFVYYFCSYLLDSEVQNSEQASKAKFESKLPPNTRVFRVHHFVSDTNNIIQNNIVATTREMWNTVVIEHPKKNTASDIAEDLGEIFNTSSISLGADWVYWPRQEVTGVIGLQFHPGLTLANKKVEVFTEINCQEPDLAAKLCLNRLAEGIKKMYRGNLVILGKNLKPYDRIILADKYTGMKGPVEVESVIHHWNTDQGWITNIVPNAVCDANPGAAVIQTAAAEATYESIYDALSFVNDISTYAIILGTLGAGTSLARGKYKVIQSAMAAAKGLLHPVQNIKRLAPIYKEAFTKALGPGALKAGTKEVFSSWGGSVSLVRKLVKEAGGPAAAYLKNQLLIGGAEFGVHQAFRMTTIPSFINASEGVEQLPVLISPLIFNNTPLTAGLEVNDSIWSVSGFGTFYSMRQISNQAKAFLDSIFGDEE